jgi:hypothetical protein
MCGCEPPASPRRGDRIDAETIATAIAADIGRTVDYRPVTNDGATRAASLVAELV